jgi:hypothetical protein
MKKLEEILTKGREGGFMSLSLKELGCSQGRDSKIPEGNKERERSYA